MADELINIKDTAASEISGMAVITANNIRIKLITNPKILSFADSRTCDFFV